MVFRIIQIINITKRRFKTVKKFSTFNWILFLVAN